MAITTAAPQRAGRREWFGLAVLALPTLLIAMDFTALHLAVPAISAALQPTSTELLWIVDSYGFAIAGLLIAMGTLGDRIGRRKLLLIGGTAFAGASLLAAFAPTAETLIAARALLGVTGATLLPSTLALITTMFTDPAQRRKAIAVWSANFLLGGVIGPLVGGVLLQWFWWGSVFLIGVPVMVVLLVLGPTLLPEFRSPEAGRIDPLSVVLFMAAVLPVVYAVKKFAEYGFGPQVWLPASIGIVVGVWFVRRQNRLAQPLLDMRLFRERSFTAALTLLVLVMAAMGGIEYLIPQFLQMVVGLSPLGAGLWMLPGAAGLLVGSQLTPMLCRSMRQATVVALGTAVATVGFVLIGVAGPDSGPLAVSVGLGVLLFGLSPMMVLGTDLVVGSAPTAQAGNASAISMTATDFGSAAGIALIGSVTTAVYRIEVGSAVPPGSAASKTIGGAVASLEPGSPAFVTAQSAFTNGVNAAAWVGAALCVLLTVGAPVALRHLRPTAEAAEEPEPHHAGS